jgi:propanol-preferring alcohol dehydrogenase
VVVGTGGLGAFAVQFLKVLSPARVVAVDVNPARLDLARELGADDALVGVGDSTTADLATCTEGRGAEAVLDFVGADATISAGLASVRPAGAFGLIGAGGGTFRGPWYGRLPREAEVFTFQGSTIADAHEVVALAEAGLIRNEVDVFPFDHVGEAYAKLERGELRGRAVVTPPA